MRPGDSVFRNILWGGLAVIVLVAPTQYSIEVLPRTFLSLVDPLIWLLAGIWLVTRRMRKDTEPIRWPPALVLLFLLMLVIAGLRTFSPVKTGKELFQNVEYFGVAWVLFASHLRDQDSVRRMLFLFLAAATGVLLTGILQYADPARDALQIGGTFGNRNVLGGYLSLVLPLVLGLLLYDAHRWRRIWYGGLLLAGIPVVLSGGTFLALCAAFGMIAAFHGHKTFLVFSGALCLLLLVVLPLLPRDNAGILYDSIAPYTQDAEPAPRYTEWQAAATMMMAHPVTGVGPGNYQENIGLYFGELPCPAGAKEPDTQNLYGVLGSTAGLPGLLLFAGLLLLSGVKAVRFYVNAGDPFLRGLSLGLAGSVMAFSINSIWSPLLVRGIGIPLVLLLCMIAALAAAGGRAGGLQQDR